MVTAVGAGFPGFNEQAKSARENIWPGNSTGMEMWAHIVIFLYMKSTGCFEKRTQIYNKMGTFADNTVNIDPAIATFTLQNNLN
jgi:hypothetical protein